MKKIEIEKKMKALENAYTCCYMKNYHSTADYDNMKRLDDDWNELNDKLTAGEYDDAYTVTVFDEVCFDDIKVFTGSLDECIDYVKGDPDDDNSYCIVEPDGFTTVEW